MAIFNDNSVSLEQLRQQFESWLRRQPAMGSARVTEFGAASAANGYSNETYLVSVAYNGDHTTLIVRLPPARKGLFQVYDIPRQYRFMQGLEDAPGVAIAPCHWLETNPEILGRPFFVVAAVPGQVAADEPIYTAEGWLVDATPAQRSRFWQSSVDQLVNLSRVRWQGQKLTSVDWYHNLARWGHQFLPGSEHPLLDDLHRWLLMHMPADQPAGIVWGDARFGNIIYRDFQPVALLDWELASVGDPEIDLAYMVLYQLGSEVVGGLPDGKPLARLEGLPSDQQTLDYYAKQTGREPRHFHYYWLFNAYRLLCMSQCMASLMVEVGRASEEEAMEWRQLRYMEPFFRQVLDSESRNACLV